MVAFLTVHKMTKRQPAKKATGAIMAGCLFVIDCTVKKATMKTYIILPEFISKSMP